MVNKKFTLEEMSELRKNRYVLDVSPSIVHFSAEFKKEFCNALIQGKLPKDIVQSFGINPKILGEISISGLKTMICTKELLSLVVSPSLEVDFVLEMVNQLIEKHGISLTAETLIHSDQMIKLH